MAYPTDPSQVGLTTAKSGLTFYDTTNGRTLQTEGASYTNQIFRGTTLIYYANNLTFTNCWFYATSGFWLVYGSGNPQNITFVNCEFGLSSTDSTIYDPDGFTGTASEKGVGAMQYRMTECYSHHQSDGHYLDNGCVVERCYMHDAIYATQTMHLDILQCSGGGHLTITDNWLELNLAADNVIVPTTGGPTAAVFVQSILGANDDVTVTGNYLDGFGFYAMQVSKNAPSLDGLIVTRNRFGRSPVAAPLTIDNGATNVTRYENRYADTLELIPGDVALAPTLATSGNNIATSGDVTLTLSASALAGDWLIVGLDVRNATDTVSVSGGAGTWTLVTDESLSTSLRKRVYKYKVPAGDTPGTTAFTFDISNNFRIRSIVWTLVRGADPTDCVDVSADALDNTGDTTRSAPSVTTTADDELVLAFFSWQGTDEALGSPTSPTLTEVTNARLAGVTLTSYLMSFLQVTAGATGTITATGSTSTTSLGATLAIKNAPPPAAPANPSATTVSDTAIDVAWDNVADETGFRVERSLTGVGAWVNASGNLAANTLTYADTGLTCNTQYFYRVFAFDTNGDSPASTVVNATTSACAPSGGGNRMGGTGAIRKPPRNVTR